MKCAYQIFAALFIGAIVVKVGCHVASTKLKMDHQICNYYDLTEFLAPICTAFYGRRFRKDVKHACELLFRSSHLQFV